MCVITAIYYFEAFRQSRRLLIALNGLLKYSVGGVREFFATAKSHASEKPESSRKRDENVQEGKSDGRGRSSGDKRRRAQRRVTQSSQMVVGHLQVYFTE